MKTYKEEIKALKHQSTTKQITIEKQEKLIDKLKFDHVQAQTVAEMTNEIKKCEMKLKKMRERRDTLKEARDSLQT